MYYLFYMQYMAIHGITWLYMGIHANTWLHIAVQGYTCQYIILNAFLIHFNNPTSSTYPQPLHQDLRTILIFTGGVVGGAGGGGGAVTCGKTNQSRSIPDLISGPKNRNKQ